MLDDTLQNRLAVTVVKGMADLPSHLKYRDQIKQQQITLERLKTSLSRSSPSSFSEEDITDILQTSWGVSPVLPEFLFAPLPENHRVVIIQEPMNLSTMISAPSLESATENLRSYATAGEKIVELAKYLLNRGYSVIPHHPMGDINEYHQLLIPPHAARSGLGEKGRTGLFISYEYGSLVRLGAITTNAPIEFTSRLKQGITEFCHRCRYCVDLCPPKALPSGTYLEQIKSDTVMDFQIDVERCFSYFKAKNGCGSCLVNCILADTSKLEIRLKRINEWYEKWIVSGELDKMYSQLQGNN